MESGQKKGSMRKICRARCVKARGVRGGQSWGKKSKASSEVQGGKREEG